MYCRCIFWTQKMNDETFHASPAPADCCSPARLLTCCCRTLQELPVSNSDVNCNKWLRYIIIQIFGERIITCHRCHGCFVSPFVPRLNPNTWKEQPVPLCRRTPDLSNQLQLSSLRLGLEAVHLLLRGRTAAGERAHLQRVSGWASRPPICCREDAQLNVRLQVNVLCGISSCAGVKNCKICNLCIFSSMSLTSTGVGLSPVHEGNIKRERRNTFNRTASVDSLQTELDLYLQAEWSHGCSDLHWHQVYIEPLQ